MKAKNAGEWLMKRPMSVRHLTMPLAIPCVSVGRMIADPGQTSGLGVRSRIVDPFRDYWTVSEKVVFSISIPDCAVTVTVLPPFGVPALPPPPQPETENSAPNSSATPHV